MHPPPLLLLLLFLCLPAAAADHYRTLGVSRDATAAAIKAAYREAALALHPDRTRGLGAEEQRRSERLFEQVNEAFQVLGDEERRAAYDRAEAAAAAAAAAAAGAAARRGEGGEAARRGAARVEAAVRCTLEQLGGWEDAPVALEVWRRVTRARLTRAEAARAGLPARLRVAAGSVAGETVRVHVPALGPAGVEVDFVLVEEAHRMWRRRGDDLWARLTLPAWHDLLRPAVRLRAIDGGTVTVWPRGRRVGRRALVRIPSRGMPRRAAAGGEALFGMPRGEMVVELVLRSVRREALLTAARAAGATCALVCARPVGRLASAWLPARLRDAAEWSLAAVGVAHDFLSVELLGRATPAARRARENARRARRANMAARELAEKRKRRDRWLRQMLQRGRGAANSVREWQRAWWAWAFDKL